MPKGSIAVYINPGSGIRIGCANSVTAGEGSDNVDFCAAATGNQNGCLTETAVKIQLTVF